MQTSATEFNPQWKEGQITRSDDPRTWTLHNEDASVMKKGYTVIKGTDKRTQGKKPVAAFTFDEFGGIIIDAVGISEKKLITGEIEIDTDQGFTVLREGFMAVKITATVAVGDDVFFVHTTGGASAQWTYRNDLDTDKASKIPARFEQAGVSGDIVEIYVNDAMQIGVS
jgi:hypothetical protein